MTIFRNPVSYSIYVAFGSLVLLSFGESLQVVFQHLVVPYTVDISHGVGSIGATIFRAVTFVLQLLAVGSIVLVVNASATGPRVALSIVGILVVVTYFLVVTLGYIAPRLH